MKRDYIWGLMVAAISSPVFALLPQKGNLTVVLSDVDGKPITDATVTVESSKFVLWGRGARSEYNYTSSASDSNGVASVDFWFYFPDFEWELKTPSHYSQRYSTPHECFKAKIEESDYLHIDTSTPDGVAKETELNEILKGIEAGDEASFTNYAEKLQPKSVEYTNKSIRRVLRFYPKKNPQPMYAYGEGDWPHLPMKEAMVNTNGYSIVEYPVVDVDLKNLRYKTSRASDAWDEGVDFKFERYFVETNGVCDFNGRMVFAPGCGAYKVKKTGDESFPSVYEADTNAVFVSNLKFYSIEDAKSGEILSVKSLLEDDEYMVLKTRMSISENGKTNGWHYSKLLGPDDINGDLFFKQSVFNPRLNDPNLEFDMKRNLANPKYEVRWP